jgi:hypothetical protein
MCVITLKEGEKERKKERKKERIAYQYRELGWDRACMLQQQVEAEVVHMVDSACREKKRKLSSKLESLLVRCDAQLALAKSTESN